MYEISSGLVRMKRIKRERENKEQNRSMRMKWTDGKKAEKNNWDAGSSESPLQSILRRLVKRLRVREGVLRMDSLR